VSLFLTFITSLMLGIRHATDSKHIVAVTIAAPSLFIAARMAGMQRTLRLASGAVSLVFGLYLAHKVGIGDGLFTSNPSWEPR